MYSEFLKIDKTSYKQCLKLYCIGGSDSESNEDFDEDFEQIYYDNKPPAFSLDSRDFCNFAPRNDEIKERSNCRNQINLQKSKESNKANSRFYYQKRNLKNHELLDTLSDDLKQNLDTKNGGFKCDDLNPQKFINDFSGKFINKNMQGNKNKKKNKNIVNKTNIQKSKLKINKQKESPKLGLVCDEDGFVIVRKHKPKKLADKEILKKESANKVQITNRFECFVQDAETESSDEEEGDIPCDNNNQNFAVETNISPRKGKCDKNNTLFTRTVKNNINLNNSKESKNPHKNINNLVSNSKSKLSRPKRNEKKPQSNLNNFFIADNDLKMFLTNMLIEDFMAVRRMMLIQCEEKFAKVIYMPATEEKFRESPVYVVEYNEEYKYQMKKYWVYLDFSNLAFLDDGKKQLITNNENPYYEFDPFGFFFIAFPITKISLEYDNSSF